MKRIINSCFLLIFAILFSFSGITVLAEEDDKEASEETYSIYMLAPARSMVALCGETNEVITGYNEEEKLPMASTTKIITAIVAIENCKDINEMVKVDDSSIGIEGTSIYLKQGEEFTLKELLLGLMLASGNDAAVAIACHIAGSEANFVKLANEFVANIGAKNTHLANAHGLDDKTHYTTAHDLALITSYALKNDIFREIASTQRTTIQGKEDQTIRYLKHKNKLLFTRDDCIGVKTGFTDNAGRCLVNACERDGFTVITVVLNCGPMFEECARVTDMIYENYLLKEFVAPYNYVGTVEVDGGEKPSFDVVTIGGYSKVIKKEDEDRYKVSYDLPKRMDAPVQVNQKIGKVVVSLDDESIYEQSLFTIQEIEKIDMAHYIDDIIEKWWIGR